MNLNPNPQKIPQPAQSSNKPINLFIDQNGAPYKRIGIFGPSESGKTTLAKKISLYYWLTEKRKTMVLDPVAQSQWGSHAHVYTDTDEFLDIIFKSKNALIIIDDGSVTIDRDKAFGGVFTTLRHPGHKLIVIGHHASNLLPQMRDQFQRVFLFLQNDDSVKHWKNIFPGQPLDQATQLQQYEFLTVANYQPLKRFMLTK